MRPRSPSNSALNVAVLAAAAGTTRAVTASATTSTSGILRIELLRVCSAGSADGFVPKVAPGATDPLPTGYRRRGSSFGSARGRRISRPGGNTDELGGSCARRRAGQIARTRAHQAESAASPRRAPLLGPAAVHAFATTLRTSALSSDTVGGISP